MVIHLTALELANQGRLQLDKAIAETSNQMVLDRNPVPSENHGAISSELDSLESRDWSNTVRCNSGVDRRAFSDMKGNPCRDECFGMCGPGCTPWTFLCSNDAVHALCWQHDSAYCPISLGTVWPGIPIPNIDYPICEAEYATYSLVIGVREPAG
jgi:hypothetical protein